MALLKMERQNKIKRIEFVTNYYDSLIKYTLPEYSKYKAKKIVEHQYRRYMLSKKKLNNPRFRAYIRLISIFPHIKMVGLSGSISMMNAKDSDDIDLFVITSRKRLFTGRFISLLIAQILGIRRKFNAMDKAEGSRDKVCLNLFFDEANLKIPNAKKTNYVGHEVLQLKLLVNKSQMYEKFILSNRWVFNFFPNATFNNIKALEIKRKTSLASLVGDIFELILKRFQLLFINRHKTCEHITDTQLWFHPVDFQNKINESK